MPRKTRAAASGKRKRADGAQGTKWRRAKVFWSGRSQAIRLPKEMRVDAVEVAITRAGDRLVIEPLTIERDAKGWPTAWWKLAGAAEDFDVGDRGVPHERGDLFFRQGR